MKRIRRREFIKYTAGLVGVSLLGRYAVLPRTLLNRGTTNGDGAAKRTVAEVRQPAIDGLNTTANQGDRLAMVIDVGACIGCRTCQWACKKENNIPDTISPPWIEIFEMKAEVDLTGHPSLEELNQGATTAYTEAPREGRWYLPVQCYHCENPPCVKVCPVGATYKDPDGLVLMDYDRCVGCRFCVVACPYSARRFNWFKPEIPPEETNQLVPVRPIGVVEKCTFCVHRVRKGKLPRCVEVCPVQARHFGNLNDPESEVSRILKANLSYRLLVEVNTGPNISYITRGRK